MDKIEPRDIEETFSPTKTKCIPDAILETQAAIIILKMAKVDTAGS